MEGAGYIRTCIAIGCIAWNCYRREKTRAEVYDNIFSRVSMLYCTWAQLFVVPWCLWQPLDVVTMGTRRCTPWCPYKEVLAWRRNPMVNWGWRALVIASIPLPLPLPLSSPCPSCASPCLWCNVRSSWFCGPYTVRGKRSLCACLFSLWQ